MSENEIELMERLIEMLGGAGEGAFWLILAWLGQGYFSPILTAAGVITALWLVKTCVVQLCVSLGAWDELRQAAKCNHPWGSVYQGERDRVLRMIRKGVEAEEREEKGEK